MTCHLAGGTPGRVLGYGALRADLASHAKQESSLAGRFQRIAYQSRVQPGGLARGLRQIPRVHKDLRQGVPFQELA